MSSFPHPASRIFRVYVKASSEFSQSHTTSPDGLSTTVLFQACIFGAASKSEEVEQTIHSKDRKGGGESPGGQVQLTGGLVVTS